jgi:hypothetical protein
MRSFHMYQDLPHPPAGVLSVSHKPMTSCKVITEDRVHKEGIQRWAAELISIAIAHTFTMLLGLTGTP